MSTPDSDAPSWKVRIVGHDEVDPATLLANPKNWRTHPEHQEQALEAVLDRVGWIQDVIVNKTTGLMLDGHLRVKMAKRRKEKSVPVKYVEVTAEEETLILASLDPIGGLASLDAEKLDSILKELSNDDDRLDGLLANLNRQVQDAFFDDDDDDADDKDKDKDDDDDEDRGDTSEFVTFAVVLERAQHETVMNAIKLVRKGNERMKISDAIALLCQRSLEE